MKIPFLYDFAAYTRFLVAIPLLILAEGLIERRAAEVVAPVATRPLVDDPDACDFAPFRLCQRFLEGRATTSACTRLFGLGSTLTVPPARLTPGRSGRRPSKKP